MLTLPIKKKWFDMIKSGVKKEEYREIKPYYDKRLFNYCRLVALEEYAYDVWGHPEFEVIFRNGYSKTSPKIKCKVNCRKGYGKPEWGAEPDKEYYVLKILSVEEVSE